MAPRPDLLSDRGREFLDEIPPVLREDPDVIAVMHCMGKEAERKDVTIDLVRAEFFPQTAVLLLALWELRAGLPPNPPGLSVEERRAAVLERLRAIVSIGAGEEWERRISAAAGGAYSYQEYEQGDPSAPAPGQIRVTIPYEVGTSPYLLIEAELQKITPAAWELIIVTGGGFILDTDQLDLERL